MRRQIILLVFIMVVTIYYLSACSENKNPTKAITPIPTSKSQNNKIKQFMEDAKLPIDIYENFEEAIQGDKKAHEWLNRYDDECNSMYFSALVGVFPGKKCLS